MKIFIVIVNLLCFSSSAVAQVGLKGQTSLKGSASVKIRPPVVLYWDVNPTGTTSGASVNATLTNSGTSPSGILTLTKLNANPAFTILSDGCTGTSLAATNGFCTINIQYIGPGGPEFEFIRATDGTNSALDLSVYGDCAAC